MGDKYDDVDVSDIPQEALEQLTDNEGGKEGIG